MLALPDVTLVCADTLNHALAARALARSCERIRFGRALFLTDAAGARVALPPQVEVRAIAPLATRDAYSRLMLDGLAAHVETSHALVVQWDGYVVNPDAWSDAFLEVDYCGAPWPWGAENRRVGNGGFSLRSRRLLDALSSPQVTLVGNEDETIGVHARAWLEATHGIRYAPVDLASRFSFEVAYPAGKPFGFHGLFNFCRVVPEAEIAALAPGFSDAIARSPQLLSLMRNCVAMGQWRAAHAIASRILAAEAGHAEARRAVDQSAGAVRAGAGVGRNDPCPCGSGKRYKLCHGALGAAPVRVDADALTREGVAAHRAGRLDEAERAYEAALAASPDHPFASHYLGVIRMQRRELASAVPRLERAAAAKPDEPDFHGNLGLAYAVIDRFDDAVASHRRAIALQPSPHAFTNLGLTLVEQHAHADAIAAYDQALSLDPAFAPARWNRAMARLALGEREAWADYEARLELDELGGHAAAPPVPRYRGGDIAGASLLVDGEQGFGDMFQFVRFVKPLADRGARVIVRSRPEIAGLLRTVPGVAEVVGPRDLPACDAWIPLMSIPGVLGADPLGDGPDPPYLFADAARASALRARLASTPARLHVGLSWSGSPHMANNRRRSCPLAALAPLLAREDIAWYSLQRDDGEDQIAAVPEARRLVLPEERRDFDGKAALIGAVDLVVSVCTSTAHLAGALGAPLWVMLAHVPDWRWGLRSGTTRWYPQARLFRQPRLGDWTSVVASIGHALDERLA